jgi:uncharacterized protein
VETLVVCAVALVASGLTFFSGFGLGTLLLPAFAVFFPAQVAVALTAVVHLLNNLFKLLLVGRRADWKVAARFGLPAVVAAFAGARVLVWLSNLRPLARYAFFGRTLHVTPLKLAIGVLMLGFAAVEVWPRFKRAGLAPRYLAVGGAVTGFFGGVSGHQGALRSAFLVRVGLEKDSFIATGVVIAAGVDLVRLAVYSETFLAAGIGRHGSLLVAAVGAAFSGALIGNRLLGKVTLRSIEATVAVMLALIAAGLASGLL